MKDKIDKWSKRKIEKSKMKNKKKVKDWIKKIRKKFSQYWCKLKQSNKITTKVNLSEKESTKFYMSQHILKKKVKIT